MKGNDVTKEKVLSDLSKLGFQAGGTRSMKWEWAFVMERDGKTLVILVRRRGFDLLLTPQPLGSMLVDGYLAVSSQYPDSLYMSYHYAESHCNVHDRVIAVAYQFSKGQAVDERLFQDVGKGLKQRREEWRAENSLYSLVRGDGGPVYLYDGAWIDEDGTLFEA